MPHEPAVPGVSWEGLAGPGFSHGRWHERKSQEKASGQAQRRGQAFFSDAPGRALASDAFEPSRRRPVDLSGGGRPPVQPAVSHGTTQTKEAPALDFVASLDDLGPG